MTFTRMLSPLAVLGLLAACVPGRPDEVTTISLDYLTTAQAEALAQPYLSNSGRVFRSADALNTITVRDRREHVRRIRSLINERDASPQNVSLHFQVVRASQVGAVDPALERVGAALRDLLKFEGYELLAQTMVSGAEKRVVEQSITAGDLTLQLGVRINDVVGSSNSGSVDMAVDLRRVGHSSLLTTNVVVPMRQTVVLGSAYPGGNGEALILTVRGEMGSSRLRTTSGRARSRDVHVDVAPAEAAEHATTVIDGELHRALDEAARANEAAMRANDAAMRANDARVVLPSGEVLGRDTPARATSPARSRSTVVPAAPRPPHQP